MLLTLLELIMVVGGLTGATLVTSKKRKVRLAGFSIFIVSCGCGGILFSFKGMYLLVIQQFIYLVIDAIGIKNNWRD